MSRSPILLLLFFGYCFCWFEFETLSSLGQNNKNAIISPISIYQSMSIAANGAKGTTQEEIVKVLSSNSRGKVENLMDINNKNFGYLEAAANSKELKIANAVLPKLPIKEQFVEIGKKYQAM